MVTNVAGSSRPRRSAAVDAVKRATQSLTHRPTRPPVVGNRMITGKSMLAQNVSKRGRKGREAEAVEAESELSELEESEEENQDQQRSSSEEEMSPSESEPENDQTSDYEEAGKQNKRKRAGKAMVQKKAAPVKRARQSKTVQTSTRKAKTGVGRAKAKQMSNRENLPIKQDNKLFNCVVDGETDLQSTAEEWVAYYQDNAGMALAQFVNFVLRCAGCNATIDEVQVLDHDKIAETLDVIQLELKKEVMPSYPLVSRAAKYRKFRRSLSDWMEKLFVCTDEADVVYDEEMMETLMAWISAMSSSAFRSLRHTSTLIALLMVEQVNRMARENRREIKAAVDNREAEKRKGAKASKIRLKDLDDKVKQANLVKNQLDGFLTELFDTVFIHRYRDSDEMIRSDCIAELGRWMKTYPEHYLVVTYFRYLGWVMSDQSEKVRLVVIKTLSSLYSRHEFIGSIQNFTERFLDRLIEMAVGDVDTSVRVATIGALTQIDQQDVLDEKARESIASHIFDIEPRVRSAVATFIKGILDEQQQESDATLEDQDSEQLKLRWKALAELLTRLDAQLDAREKSEGRAEDGFSSVAYSHSHSRIGVAMGAIYDVDEGLQDWNALVQLLLYDHSHQKARQGRGRKKGGAARGVEEAGPHDGEYRLEAAEESVLVEALGVALERWQSRSQAVAAKGGETGKEGQTDRWSLMTRDLIPVLPKLFKKYRTEAGQIAELLVSVKHLDLDAYLDFQQVGAFEALWDEVIDQFQRHIEANVLSHAVDAMSTMKDVGALSNISGAKMANLCQAVFQSLQQSVEGQVLQRQDGLDEEHLHHLNTCSSRLMHLIRAVDLSSHLDERGEGVQQEEGSASAWQVLLSVAKRGSFAKPDESVGVCSSLAILSLCTMWSSRAINAMQQGEGQEQAIGRLEANLGNLTDVMDQLLEESGEEEEATLMVKRQAFRQLLDLYILFASMHASDAAPTPLRLKCSPESQERLTAFVRSEIARRVEEEERSRSGDDQGDGEDGSLDTETGRQTAAGRPTLAFLQRQMTFVSTLSHFIGAIRLGVVHVKQSVCLLSHFASLGPLYDACLRVVVDTIRDVGIHEGKPKQACRVILDSLWRAHQRYCQSPSETTSEARLINLAKMLSSGLVVRGAQLAVLKSIDGRAVVNLHSRGVRLVMETMQGREADDDDEEQQQQRLCFFKALSHLLISVGPREAVTIKKNMDQIIQDFAIDVAISSSKVWDALRQYEKRLVTIASKSDAVRQHVEARRAAATKSRPNQSSPSPQGQEDGNEAEQEVRELLLLDDDGSRFDLADETREEGQLQQMDLTLDEGEIEQ